LSRETLRGAIASRELKAQIVGKAWRVKRKDLEEYIDNL
jgi:excisionase family DNA binding protein